MSARYNRESLELKNGFFSPYCGAVYSDPVWQQGRGAKMRFRVMASLGWGKVLNSVGYVTVTPIQGLSYISPHFLARGGERAEGRVDDAK
jgi:hypothetical protein